MPGTPICTRNLPSITMSTSPEVKVKHDEPIPSSSSGSSNSRRDYYIPKRHRRFQGGQLYQLQVWDKVMKEIVKRKDTDNPNHLILEDFIIDSDSDSDLYDSEEDEDEELLLLSSSFQLLQT